MWRRKVQVKRWNKAKPMKDCLHSRRLDFPQYCHIKLVNKKIYCVHINWSFHYENYFFLLLKGQFSSSPIQGGTRAYSLGSITSPTFPEGSPAHAGSPAFSPIAFHIRHTPLSGMVSLYMYYSFLIYTFGLNKQQCFYWNLFQRQGSGIGMPAVSFCLAQSLAVKYLNNVKQGSVSACKNQLRTII